MTALDDRPAILAIQPCACPDRCGHRECSSLIRGTAGLDAALTMQAEVIQDAVRRAAAQGPGAGIQVLVDYLSEVPEIADGLGDSLEKLRGAR